MKTMTRAALGVASALSALVVVVPPASADTTLPTWTCRASAVQVTTPLTGYVEPIQANGNPVAGAGSDRETCAPAATGVQDTQVPPGGLPLINLNAVSASTSVDPSVLLPARDQDIAANAGATDTTDITVGGISISVASFSSRATGTCDANNLPVLDSPDSTVLQLTINNTPINLAGPIQALNPILGVLGIDLTLNEETTPTATSLVKRALVLDIDALDIRVVIGEVRVGYNGAVCAAAPPPASCPAGTVPQQGSNPLTCVLTQTAPCPSGSAADPNRGGACVVVGPPGACPSGAIRVPDSGACIFVLQRPCPSGSSADPSTRVCVAVGGSDNNTLILNGRENGRIGGPNGPVPTCGKVSMRFVRGNGSKLTSKLGTRVVTRGRLVSCERKPRPIVSARIDVIHVLPNGKRLRKTGLRSRGDGKLTLILPNDLRSRRIEFGYRPNLDRAKVSSRVTLGLTVKNRRGRTIR